MNVHKYLRNTVDIHKIDERLYLGSYSAALVRKNLEALKITHVLSIGDNVKAYLYPEFKYLYINVPDYNETLLIEHFEDTYQFIEEAREKGAVFVHCFAGISRSATLVIAYLMKKKNMRLMEAYDHVKRIRRIVNPIPGFRRQLQMLDMDHSFVKCPNKYALFLCDYLMKFQEKGAVLSMWRGRDPVNFKNKFPMILESVILSKSYSLNLNCSGVYTCTNCNRILFTLANVYSHHADREY
eukprot:TRINITY_DN5261_c0_g1_i1.p1 TRINITY_DN5261_c0_g1~~TRINITY_DN5261_c0_g1_i1.p1  ORF type:complete len:240 (+),score=20.91 TRINITY_DN5261_c0_g1_i1:39-758(+)